MMRNKRSVGPLLYQPIDAPLSMGRPGVGRGAGPYQAAPLCISECLHIA